MTDEEIERERARLEALVGPTHAGWYAEACKAGVLQDADEALREAGGDVAALLASTNHNAFLWACRCRELVRAAGHLAHELAFFRQWVEDLQSGMYVNCVYCGHRYGPGETTPVSMADALKAHAEQCPKHPLAAAVAKAKRLEAMLRPPAVTMMTLTGLGLNPFAAELLVEAWQRHPRRQAMGFVLKGVRVIIGENE